MPKSKTLIACRICFQSVAVVLVLFALAVSLIRGLLPHLPEVRSEIVDYLYQQYQLEVQVGEVSAEWQAYGPALTVSNIVIPPQQAIPVTAIASKVHLKLDFWQTLLSLSPQIETVKFDGIHVALNMDALASSEATSAAATDLDWLYALLLEQLETFSISDGTLQLLSNSHDYRPIFISNLTWHNMAGMHRAKGFIHLDEQASEKELLALRVDLKGSGYQPDNLKGQVYISAESLDLGEWASRQHEKELKLDSIEFEGIVNLKAWLGFEHRTINTGLLVFEPSWLQWHGTTESQKFEIGGGALTWQPSDNGWQINSYDLDFKSNEQAWPELQLSLKTNYRDLSVSVNQIAPEMLTPLLPLIPSMGLKGVEQWGKLQPQGSIGPLQLLKVADKPLLFKTDIKQLQWQPAGNIPGSKPIDGSLSWANNLLSAEFPAQQYQLDFQDGFEAPLTLSADAFKAQYSLAKSRLTLPKVHFYNDDIDLAASMQLDMAAQAHLALNANVAISNAANAGRYFPLKTMSDDLVSYLNQAILKGHIPDAQVVWHGDLSGFPYQDSSGIFQAGFNLNDGAFEFQPDWPKVDDLSLYALFENAAMDIMINKGKLLDVNAAGAHVYIPFMGKDTTLKIEAEIAATAAAAKTLIDNSPLQSSVGTTLDVVQISGDIISDLDLTIPMYEGGVADNKGLIHFNDNQVFIATPGLNLEKVNGTVAFINAEVNGNQINADLFEQPLTFDFGTNKTSADDLALSVGLKGLWDLDNLPDYIDNPLSDYYSGQLDWDGGVTMIFDATGYSLQVQLNSDLVGAELSLPAPFTKAAATPTRLSAELIGDNKQASLGLKLAKQAEFWGGFNQQSGDNLAHYDLILGRQFKLGDKLAKDQGHIIIDLPDAVLTQWLPIISQFTDKASSSIDLPDTTAAALVNTEEEMASIFANKPAAESAVVDTVTAHAAETSAPTENQPSTTEATLTRPKASFFPPLALIDAKVGKLDILAQDFNQLSFSAKPLEHVWRFDVLSQEFDGRIDFYSSWREQGLKVVASKLHLTPRVKPAEEAEFSPDNMLDNLPPLAVDVDDFGIYDRRLGHLVLQGIPYEDGYRFQTLTLTRPIVSLQATGDWTFKDGKNLTKFDVKLKASKFDALSEVLGINPGLKDAPLDLVGEFSWQGPPYGFSLDTLNGKLRFDMGKGYLSEISDKGARIFSLFSLDSIVRKLSLDFSDVFGKGLHFDSFGGSLNIDNGVVKTTDTEMDAIAGNMKVRGYTDLTTQSLNYDIRFIPQLASSVPTVVLLSTSAWTLGLGAFALTKVLEPVIEVISEIRFRLGGTMTEPQLEELERKSKEIEIPESILPRTPATQVSPDKVGAGTVSSEAISSKVESVELNRSENQPNATDVNKANVNKANVNDAGVNDAGVNEVDATDINLKADEAATEAAANIVSFSLYHRQCQGGANASQFIAMSKQHRCQSQSGLYRLAA
ncbi:YhdP family protein [Shewanella sp. 4_MG-2023]|uniref:YhdP family protein n=1 Tax=Shewanella sp. 4_MG-2023 TaxID=3062652 RepID=UPI0026E39CD2|nr:YhdP family protein [Shewanella sp. 4_MG-2023]MDO6678635.1 YhdP family protein [Shewanella sp. 4_MG-2023]